MPDRPAQFDDVSRPHHPLRWVDVVRKTAAVATIGFLVLFLSTWVTVFWLQRGDRGPYVAGAIAGLCLMLASVCSAAVWIIAGVASRREG